MISLTLPNVVAVADTHTAIWYLFADARLSPIAKRVIDDAATRGTKIAVSSVSLAELVYLVEKGRLPPVAYLGLAEALADPKHVFTEAVFSASIVDAMRLVSRTEVPDMPDRMIAATGVFLNVPVISRDRRIQGADLKTIW